MPESSASQRSILTVTSRRGIYAGLLFAGLAIVYGFYLLLWPGYQRRQLLVTGLAAEGVITAVETTGNVRNSQPEVRVNVHVTPEQGASFDTEVTMVLDPVYAPQFQPGNRVRIRYDHNDYRKAAIEAVATY